MRAVKIISEDEPWSHYLLITEQKPGVDVLRQADNVHARGERRSQVKNSAGKKKNKTLNSSGCCQSGASGTFPVSMSVPIRPGACPTHTAFHRKGRSHCLRNHVTAYFCSDDWVRPGCHPRDSQGTGWPVIYKRAGPKNI